MCLDIDRGEEIGWCDRLYILYNIDDYMIDVCMWFNQSMIDHIDSLSDSLVGREYSWWDQQHSLYIECTQENPFDLCESYCLCDDLFDAIDHDRLVFPKILMYTDP